MIPWVVIAAGIALSEMYPVHLRFRGEAHSFSLSEIWLVLGLFATSPLRLVLAQFVGVAIALGIVRRRSPVKLVFNLAQFVLGTEIAILVFRALAVPSGALDTRNWLAALVAAAVSSVLQLSPLRSRSRSPSAASTLATTCSR